MSQDAAEVGTVTTESARTDAVGNVFAGYAAAVWAALFAVVSLYWAAGGTLGVATVGGQIAAMAGSGDPTAALLAWGAAAVKVAGVVFALALVRKWGRIFPRTLMLVAGRAAAVIMIGYGAVNISAELAVVLGIVTGPTGADLYALHWHLMLWDPWFLTWGILLWLAVRNYARVTRLGRA